LCLACIADEPKGGTDAANDAVDADTDDDDALLVNDVVDTLLADADIGVGADEDDTTPRALSGTVLTTFVTLENCASMSD
jgi:hypothetical protein